MARADRQGVWKCRACTHVLGKEIVGPYMTSVQLDSHCTRSSNSRSMKAFVPVPSKLAIIETTSLVPVQVQPQVS